MGGGNSKSLPSPTCVPFITGLLVPPGTNQVAQATSITPNAIKMPVRTGDLITINTTANNSSNFFSSDSNYCNRFHSSLLSSDNTAVFTIWDMNNIGLIGEQITNQMQKSILPFPKYNVIR